jgi:hypothetical protein
MALISYLEKFSRLSSGLVVYRSFTCEVSRGLRNRPRAKPVEIASLNRTTLASR